MELFKRFLEPIRKSVSNNNFKKPPKVRKNVTNISIQKDVYFQVYWKELKVGKGPAVILYIYDKEILKFDCFGKGKGHYHVNFCTQNGAKVNRLYFIENNAKEQIERTAFELEKNLNYYLERNIDPRIRQIHLKQDSLEKAVCKIKSKMTEFLSSIPELRDI